MWLIILYFTNAWISETNEMWVIVSCFITARNSEINDNVSVFLMLLDYEFHTVLKYKTITHISFTSLTIISRADQKTCSLKQTSNILIWINENLIPSTAFSTSFRKLKRRLLTDDADLDDNTDERYVDVCEFWGKKLRRSMILTLFHTQIMWESKILALFQKSEKKVRCVFPDNYSLWKTNKSAYCLLKKSKYVLNYRALKFSKFLSLFQVFKNISKTVINIVKTRRYLQTALKNASNWLALMAWKNFSLLKKIV